MGGIAGIVDFERPLAAWSGPLRAMQRALRHRGPGGEGRLERQGIGLAQTRAAAHPSASAQPLVSACGRYALVYDGALQDLDGLRRRLSPELSFQTRTEDEVVLAACALYGERALPELNGAFALFFWDAVRQVGFAARDRLGVRPLVFSVQGGQLRFASEAKALVSALGDAPRLHLPSFVEWLVVPGLSGVDHAPFQGVEVLPGGCALGVSRAGVEERRWAAFRPASIAPPGVERAAELRRRLEAAIRDATRTDQPLGIFLSGGLGSTAIAAVAREARPGLPGYTVRFENQDRFDYARSRHARADDTPFAGLAAQALALPHVRVEVPRRELAADLARLASIDDRLPSSEQAFARHRLARAASEGLRAVLVGDAANETHYGFPLLLDKDATSSPLGFLRYLAAPERVALLHPRLAAEIVPLRMLEQGYRRLAEEAGLGWGSPRDGILATRHLIARRRLPRVLHDGDIHTMAFTLEVRAPFADARLLELAEAVPPELGLAGGVEKALLRAAAPEAVPEAIRWRPGSALPRDQGVEGLFRTEALRVLREAEPAVERYLNTKWVAQLASVPRPLSELERAMLFQTIAFFHWCRHYQIQIA